MRKEKNYKIPGNDCKKGKKKYMNKDIDQYNLFPIGDSHFPLGFYCLKSLFWSAPTLKFCLLRVCYGKGDFRPFFYLFLSKTGTERVRPFLTETDCKKLPFSEAVANT